MTAWGKGRGRLGPLKPLLGNWMAESPAGATGMDAVQCTRSFREFGSHWVELDARWNMGSRGTYREIALIGPGEDGLVFHSFTNDGKRSVGHQVDAADVHQQAFAFEAQMAAGTARMIYWPSGDGRGFNFAVESRTKAGWKRFLSQAYGPLEAE